MPDPCTKPTARVVILAEGEYDIPLDPADPLHLSAMLEGLGIMSRNGQLFMDGKPVVGDPVVQPGSETLLMPHIRGG